MSVGKRCSPEQFREFSRYLPVVMTSHFNSTEDVVKDGPVRVKSNIMGGILTVILSVINHFDV